jgi:hypothetical protein
MSAIAPRSRRFLDCPRLFVFNYKRPSQSQNDPGDSDELPRGRGKGAVNSDARPAYPGTG